MENKAKEILDYCMGYFNVENLSEKQYKEMLKQIEFLIDTS